MEAFGVRLVVAPETTATALAFVVGGVALGTCSGLVPGLHANNFALLLAAFAPSIPGPPRFVGAAMLAAGVTHTFLDVIPALALGVPDPAMAATALPGHRLVAQGRGREALRLSALGSGIAVLLALALAWPFTAAMERIYPALEPHLPAVLAALAVAIVLSERSATARLGAAAGFLASAGLGLATLDAPIDGVLPVGDVLAPLFAGLFGAPVLVEALDGTGVPTQGDAAVTVPRRLVLAVALVGGLAGAVVGYLPGVSSAIAATGALVALPKDTGARGFVIASSGVNTANAIFALFALVALGSPRTGVLVAFEETGAPLNLPLLLGAVVIAGAVGFLLVLLVGDYYLRAVGAVDNTHLSLGVLGLLAVLSYLFAGAFGVGVFLVATLVGLIPPRMGSRRVCLMGVLIGPLILGG